MVKKGYTPEQIIGKLREAEIHLSQGASIAEASKQLGVTEQTYYRWRKEYGVLPPRMSSTSCFNGLFYEVSRSIFALIMGQNSPPG